MKKLINNIFILLIIAVNLAYLPQAIIAITKGVPLVSSISYSYEYIALGLDNNFQLIRYSKDIFVVILLIFIILDIIERKRVDKLSLYIFVFIFMIILPMSILSLNFSNEFSIPMIISGTRLLIFTTTIIIYSREYLDYIQVTKIYKLFSYILKIIFITVVFQSLIVISRYNTINISKYRVIGTFAGSGLLGLFGVGMITFLIIYKEKIDSECKIVFNSILIAFIIIASGTRTGMVVYAVIMFSYIYAKVVNLKNNIKLTGLFFIISIFVGVIILNLAEVVADRGDAISAQFNNGRVSFILDYIKESNLKEMLIGKGIGYGTNTAISMLNEVTTNIESTTKVMDGSVNILITQYGLLLTCILGLIYIYIIKEVLKQNIQNEIKIIFILTSVILILIGNVFEQFSFQVFFILNNCIIVSNLDISRCKYNKLNTG